MGIGILLILFLALGIISYFQIGQIDENLTEVIQGKDLGNRIALLYKRYQALDDALTKNKSSQYSLFATTAENFEKIDNIIVEKIRTRIDLKGPDGHQKMLQSSKLEADIDEITNSLSIFFWTPTMECKKHIFDNVSTFEQELNRFKNLCLSEDEKNSAVKIQTIFNQTIPLIEEIIVLNNYLQENASELRHIRAKLDELMDEELEVFTSMDLERAKEAGRKIVGTAVTVTLILVLTGFLDVSVITFAYFCHSVF